VSRKGRRAVVLTNDGDFQSVRLRRSAHLSIGQTVRSEHLFHFKSLLRSIMAPVIACTFSLLCFAPLTQSSIESAEPAAAYVHFEFASGIEASIDRNLNIISVRTAGNKHAALVSDLASNHNLSFKEFTEILVGRISRSSEWREGTSLLFSTAMTKQTAGKDSKQLDHQLIHIFTGQTLRLIPGATFQMEPAMTSHRMVTGTPVVSAVNGQLQRRAGQSGTIVSVKHQKTLSASGINKVIPSFTAPLQKFMEKIKGTGEVLNRSEAEGASYQINAIQAPFQDPFRNMERNRKSNTSSYLFPHQNLFAPQDRTGLREA
jgi:hypothetical protein